MVLLWQTRITDLLFFRFVIDWLFPHFQKGVHNMRAEQVAPFFRELMSEIAGEQKRSPITVSSVQVATCFAWRLTSV